MAKIRKSRRRVTDRFTPPKEYKKRIRISVQGGTFTEINEAQRRGAVVGILMRVFQQDEAEINPNDYGFDLTYHEIVTDTNGVLKGYGWYPIGRLRHTKSMQTYLDDVQQIAEGIAAIVQEQTGVKTIAYWQDTREGGFDNPKKKLTKKQERKIAFLNKRLSFLNTDDDLGSAGIRYQRLQAKSERALLRARERQTKISAYKNELQSLENEGTRKKKFFELNRKRRIDKLKSEIFRLSLLRADDLDKLQSYYEKIDELRAVSNVIKKQIKDIENETKERRIFQVNYILFNS